ncbi:hypothetical protein [Algibacter pectinivorans]|uniref:Lipocalin-like domain-containing protein n=1 Tax=Algibacter pectinivorans TaxID=870482 RepID=A0A1I1QIV8_9FLAO|nr:hypothetical protein [Algibacter pectinivorans]SFD22074.1 hypothetical protein SAMN04487987_106206 [Algibacter pectinivorans]
MKRALKSVVIVLLLLVVTSCTKDTNGAENNLRGIWEQVKVLDGQTNTLQLVFGKKNTGFEINKVEFGTGEITSSASPFSWKIENDTIEVNGTSKDTYQFNVDNELVLDTGEDVVLSKISNDYSKYYGKE